MTQKRHVPPDRVLRIGRAKVQVRVEGSGDPILLLNGLTRPLESWGPFTRALAGRTTISLDVPGVGRSPMTSPPMSIPAVARLAASVLDELGHSTADVVGFSHGGAVAQQLAVDVPERVRRLTLVSTSCGYGATPPGWDLLGVRTFYPVWDTFGWPRPDVLATVWHALAFATWTSIPFLGWIQAPTLVVSGARDRVVPPANSRLLAQRIPDARLVLLPGGHDLQRPRPAVELAAAVERFLGEES